MFRALKTSLDLIFFFSYIESESSKAIDDETHIALLLLKNVDWQQNVFPRKRQNNNLFMFLNTEAKTIN